MALAADWKCDGSGLLISYVDESKLALTDAQLNVTRAVSFPSFENDDGESDEAGDGMCRVVTAAV
jgi:hypothetical protein